MAFDNDDERARKQPKSDPPASLGDLAADLSGSAVGEEAEEAIDSAALAALSQAPSARKAAADDAGPNIRLKDVPAELAAVRASTPPAKPEGRRLGMGAVIGALVIGFGIGVPVGGVLFSSAGDGEARAARTTEPLPPPPAASPPPSAAHEDDIAATARLPLPGPGARRAPEPQPAEDTEQSPTAAADNAQPPAETPAPPPTAALAFSDVQRLRAVPRPALKPPPAAPPAAASSKAPEPPPPAATPAPPKPAAGNSENRTMNELLDQAADQAIANSGGQHVLPEPGARPAAPPPPGMPMAPSRDDVTRAMTVLLPAIRGCAGGESGLATLGIVVRNDGHVENVAVTGAPFEGARSGRCMEGVVRKAKFPRFQQSSFRVQFPFMIQ